MPTFNAPERESRFYAFPLKNGETVYQGEIGCIDATGEIVTAKKATGLKAFGRVEKIDSGSITLRKGCYRYQNDAADPVTFADIGGNCYISNSTTVCKTDASSTKSTAGKVMFIDDAGVWVEF